MKKKITEISVPLTIEEAISGKGGNNVD